MKNENLNIPVLSVEELKSLYMKVLSGAIEKNVPFSRVPAPFLWGPPGVGKSQGVFQIAREIEKKYGLTVEVTDVRLLLFSPVDLKGIPVADVNKEFCNWLMPSIFKMKADCGTVNILFLDELSAAPQQVQAAAYQICLDRKVGEHKLPDNCIIIAAGNRTTDQSVSYKMPKALCNRLSHFSIRPDYGSWRKWAVKNGIAKEIIAYLAFDNSRLCVEPDPSDFAYPTPRSWEFVSTYMETVDCDVSEMGSLISSCVGNDTAIEFMAFCKGASKMPPVSDIFEGKCKVYPKSHDVMYVLVSSLAAAVSAKGTDITYRELDNLWDYVSGFLKEYLVMFVNDLLNIEGMKNKLMKCYGFQDWLAKNKT